MNQKILLSMYTAIFLMTASNTVTMHENSSTPQDAVYIKRTESGNKLMIRIKVGSRTVISMIPIEGRNQWHLSDQEILDFVKENALTKILSHSSKRP